MATRRTDRGMNALHLAITEGQHQDALRLINTGPAELTRGLNRRGCTPLMLLAMGQGGGGGGKASNTTLLRALLDRGAAYSGVELRSEAMMSAADYAKLQNQPAKLVVELEQLGREERARTAEGRCSVCGERLRKRPRLAFYADRADRGEEDNPLLQRFFRAQHHLELLQPHYHQLSSVRSVRKELSESIAVLDALAAAVGSAPPAAGVAPELDGGAWHLVDLCCGKSFTAAVATLRWPGLVVTAVDRVNAATLPHWNEGAANRRCTVKYASIDVLSDDFVPALREIIGRVDRPTLLVGMHLCGQLSVRAIDAFGNLAGVQAAVLSPCCLPRRGNPGSPPHLYFTKDDRTQYLRWAEHLEMLMSTSFPGANVTSQAVEAVLSRKNVIICGVKPTGKPDPGPTSSTTAAAAERCPDLEKGMGRPAAQG